MNHDIDILARTIYGEARGEIEEGKRAVGLCILNRYKSKKWFSANTIAEVCQKPLQFSCWNKNDPNCKKITTATDYHTKNCRPAWSRGKLPCAIIGNHVFFNNID